MNNNYIKATSENLPCVDLEMLLDFLSNSDDYSSVEMKGVKTVKSMRPNYGDGAVGYVQLIRKQAICTVEAKICPEHKVHNKNYKVTVVIDEQKELVKDAKCHDCAASQGGCKHAVALLAWMYRRSEEAAPTSVVCYWARQKLSEVASHIKFKKIKDIVGDNVTVANNEDHLSNSDDFLSKVLNHEKITSANSHLIKIFQPSPFKLLSMHYNAARYGGDKSNCQEFLKFCAENIQLERCKIVYEMTKGQSASTLWHELRYGRITASVLYEAAQCQKTDGYLVEKILGMSNFDTLPMKRGRELEDKMIQKVTKALDVKIEKCGLILNSEYPAFGASPDGKNETSVFEVKCPAKVNKIKNYYKNNQINKKYKAQIQLQMLFASKFQAYFCLADPNFETNGKVTVIVENFDEKYIKAVLKRADHFWRSVIFSALLSKMISCLFS